MSVRVVNLRTDKYDVYIGRGSKWGNPYSHKTGTSATYKVSSRDMAISKYREYILNGIGRNLINELHELDGKTLGCYCKPYKCHGDVLVELYKLKYPK